MSRKKIRKQGSDFGVGLETHSAKETKKFGRDFVSKLIIDHQPLIIALTGDLGSGKTTFVQGLAEGLGIKQRILSPTFIIMRQYDIPKINHRASTINYFFHVDLYRLDENVKKEMRNLGTEEIFSDPENIIAIEWAEKGRDAIPKDAVWIKFENLGEDKRKIEVVD